MDFKIIPYNDSWRPDLEVMLRDYLTFVGNHIKSYPWNYTIDIEQELAFTFNNLQAFTPPKGRIFMAVISNNAIGTASVKMIRDNVAELKRLYVSRSYRGKKFGELLMDSIFDLAKEYGAKEIYLDSPPPFKPAHDLFRRKGFEVFSQYPEVSIPNELKVDWVYMRKELEN